MNFNCIASHRLSGTQLGYTVAENVLRVGVMLYVVLAEKWGH